MEKITAPKKLIALRIEPHLIEYLDGLAFKQERSRSQVIRMIVSQYRALNDAGK